MLIHHYLLILIPALWILFAVAVSIRVILDTSNSTKTIAYLLLIFFAPFIGIPIYFTFGINYHKRKLYRDKLKQNQELLASLKGWITKETYYNTEVYKDVLEGKEDLVSLLLRDIFSPLTNDNQVKLLINGENKFPEVFEALERAEKYIHIEYYIYEDDEIGNKLKDILIRKAKQGIVVRMIYDDFGSHRIKKHLAEELKEAGIQASPFYEVKFFFLANRYNYRDHRKIIIIDGRIGFTGGINVSDKYINNKPGQMYWRDTHMKIEGEGVYMLQYLFMSNWNFCCEKLELSRNFFPEFLPSDRKQLVQIAGSGPDSDRATIMLSFLTAIATAKKQLYITSPYFIPGETIMNAIVKAALSEVDVRILVPGFSDAKLVNYASRGNYGELLDAGARIFRYKKGFVHAKTMAVDENLSLVGTANMDLRSFDLNFEVIAVVYDRKFNEDLKKAFLTDLENSEEILREDWNRRSTWNNLLEQTAKLISPVL